MLFSFSRRRVCAVVLVSSCAACGGSADGAGGAGGRPGATGGDTGGVSAGGEFSAGGAEGSRGGSEASGGSAAGGASASGGTSAAGSGGVGEDCPVMPASRALPVVAVFFSGPDPGPCTSQTNGDVVSDYIYEDGLPMGSTGSENLIYERDSEGRILSLDSGAVVDTFDWGDGEVTQTNDYQIVVFHLDELGYPRTADVTVLDSSSSAGRYTYEWVDCRLERLLRPDGTVRTYHYDDEDHVILVDHGSSQVEYTYDCW